MEVIRAIKSTSKIKSIKSIGRGPSYDFTVKDTHRILASGFYTSNCNHPEIETFIHIKRDRTKITGANISIRVTDEFMHAVESDGNFTLQWPVDVPVSEAKVVRVVKARDIWDQFIDAGWDSAEPGILFWDAMVNNGVADIYKDLGFKTVSTNPCAELALSEGDSCRLLAIDITHFVENPFLPNATFNFESFDKCAQIAQRLMDDIVDLEIEMVDKIIQKVESDPESAHVKMIELNLWKKIREACVNGRRTGLGLTAVGDGLAMLNVKYGSEESVEWTERIYRALALASYRSSVTLAEERGTFPIYNYDLEKNHVFIQRIMSQDPELEKKYKKFGRRNIANTTTAPVGSLSTMTQTTSGIEPVFMLSYTRRKKINPNDVNAKVDFVDAVGDKWTNYTIYHHGFRQWMEATGKTDPAESPYHGATCNDIDWLMSVKLQAAAQKWVCHSISKTCNLPQNASHDLVSKVYLEAWKSGCKGFTVYRDKSRDGVLVNDDGKVQIDIKGRYDGVPVEEIEKMLEIGKKYEQNMPSGYKKTLDEVKTYLENRVNPQLIVERVIANNENHAVKRPKELECDIRQVKIAG